MFTDVQSTEDRCPTAANPGAWWGLGRSQRWQLSSLRWVGELGGEGGGGSTDDIEVEQEDSTELSGTTTPIEASCWREISGGHSDTEQRPDLIAYADGCVRALNSELLVRRGGRPSGEGELHRQACGNAEPPR